MSENAEILLEQIRLCKKDMNEAANFLQHQIKLVSDQNTALRLRVKHLEDIITAAGVA